MPTRSKPKSVDEFLKKTSAKEIHEAFLNNVNELLAHTKLHKKTYFKGIAEQQAAKASLISNDKKTLWKLKFVEEKKMWMYCPEKILPGTIR